MEYKQREPVVIIVLYGVEEERAVVIIVLYGVEAERARSYSRTVRSRSRESP